eukprot:CAMPEP_0176415162 /NCGR_PEP_ID=MMETSP0127-20121128/5655_1 /TAXON_ID=938130 /ORGANISM="Platyophrya macrostoma, Strain WH" /LENGTH=471 /DNA_ID=CAMNT_0017795131 /DNA_START=61 /DNA_END=1476 /DNA_ORIENTATION=+
MSIFGEVWRHTFPKGLSYCRQSLILHSCLVAVVRRYKHKKYIPRTEIEDALAAFVHCPGSPVVQLPIVRHVLLLRLVNGIRVSLLGKPSWLFTRDVERHHRTISAWVEADAAASAAPSGATGKTRSSQPAPSASRKAPPGMVDRERFQSEVLDAFPVAQMYHRVFRLGIVMLVVLSLIAVVETFFMELLHLYLRYWCQLDRAEVKEYWREVTERHAISDVPPSYAGRLPPPCVLVSKKQKQITDTMSSTSLETTPSLAYQVNVVELVSPDERHKVVCIPCPQVGPRAFYEAVGTLLRSSDVVMLEGVPLSHVDRMPPSLLLPMKQPTFSRVGMCHRYFDILHNNTREPPKLFPAALTIGWSQWIAQATVPLPLRMLLFPTLVTGTKAEAKVAWGRLREVMGEEALSSKHPEHDDSLPTSSYVSHKTIALPWSTAQIVNLEASLLKMGFRVLRQFPLEWVDADAMGNCFTSA